MDERVGTEAAAVYPTSPCGHPASLPPSPSELTLMGFPEHALSANSHWGGQSMTSHTYPHSRWRVRTQPKAFHCIETVDTRRSQLRSAEWRVTSKMEKPQEGVWVGKQDKGSVGLLTRAGLWSQARMGGWELGNSEYGLSLTEFYCKKERERGPWLEGEMRLRDRGRSGDIHWLI